MGERRPLILAALSEAVECETKLLEKVQQCELGVEASLPPSSVALQQAWTLADDLVRLGLARGASLSKPSETGVLPLEYSIRKHSLRVGIIMYEESPMGLAGTESMYAVHAKSYGLT